ncbi:MAG: hypothetical protein ABWJ98_03040 [Hydrogenothermaceae bacterium]
MKMFKKEEREKSSTHLLTSGKSIFPDINQIKSLINENKDMNFYIIKTLF